MPMDVISFPKSRSTKGSLKRFLETLGRVPDQVSLLAQGSPKCGVGHKVSPYRTPNVVPKWGVSGSDGGLQMWGKDWVEAGGTEGERIDLSRIKQIEIY